MLPDEIMQSNLLDILFENRNKTYGAYTLRASYNKTLKRAIGFTIILCACSSLLLSVNNNKHHDYVTTTVFLPDIKLEDVKSVIQKSPQPSHAKSAVNVKQVNTSTPVITSDDIKPTQPTVDDIDKSLISSITADGTESSETAPVSSEKAGSLTISTNNKPAVENELPLLSADIMPEFPGGTNALIKFILRNIHQPDDLQADEKIKVIASFVVSKTGSIESIKIISSGRTDLDKEVIRVINKMPLWKPGFQNGRKVDVYFNLPVTFQSAAD